MLALLTCHLSYKKTTGLINREKHIQIILDHLKVAEHDAQYRESLKKNFLVSGVIKECKDRRSNVKQSSRDVL